MPFSSPFWSPQQASAVLFDWDGVIADTHLDFSGIYQKYYGGKRAMLLEDIGTLSSSEQETIMRDLEALEMAGAYEATPVHGADDILRWVREQGIPWAVVSRNCKKSIVAAADVIGVRLPEIVRSRDDGDSVKPDPRALLETCRAIGADPAQTLFIGDFIYDMIGARRAGMRGVLVRKEIRPEWAPWLECAYTSMHGLSDELASPSEITAWEYRETEERLGRDFLRAAHRAILEVPLAATPNLAAWLIRAASLGVGAFLAPDGVLSPQMWRENQSFEPAQMGMPLLTVLQDFLRVRCPFAKVLAAPNGQPILSPPTDAGDLEDALRAR